MSAISFAGIECWHFVGWPAKNRKRVRFLMQNIAFFAAFLRICRIFGAILVKADKKIIRLLHILLAWGMMYVNIFYGFQEADVNRREARETAFKLIYELGFHGFSSTDELTSVVEESALPDIYTQGEDAPAAVCGEESAYILAVVRGIAEHVAEIDGMIEKYAKNWKVSRLSRVTRAILRLAVYEIFHMDGIPSGVSANEAVELAKKYESKEASVFINGVLGSVIREEKKTV
jgi:N utilization substance protein B